MSFSLRGLLVSDDSCRHGPMPQGCHRQQDVATWEASRGLKNYQYYGSKNIVVVAAACTVNIPPNDIDNSAGLYIMPGASMLRGCVVGGWSLCRHGNMLFEAQVALKTQSIVFTTLQYMLGLNPARVFLEGSAWMLSWLNKST